MHEPLSIHFPRAAATVAPIFAVRADYPLSPFTAFSNLIQFDTESQNLGWDSNHRRAEYKSTL